MIDLRFLRDNPDAVRASQRARGEDPALVDALLGAGTDARVIPIEMPGYARIVGLGVRLSTKPLLIEDCQI